MRLIRRALGYALGLGFMLFLAYLLSVIGSPLSDATDAAQGRTIAQQRHIVDPAACPAEARRQVREGCADEVHKGAIRAGSGAAVE